MTRLARHWPTFLLGIAITVCPKAFAQHSTSGSGSLNNGGAYNWQVDQTGTTTTLGATLNMPAPLCETSGQLCYVQIPVTIYYNGSGGTSTTTIHSVQGTISLSAWPEGSQCSQAVAIAEVRTVPYLNVVAAVKLQQFPQGTANVPISATLSTPLSGVTQFQVQVLNDVGCQEALAIQLTMN
jgi:hypothetical protein